MAHETKAEKHQQRIDKREAASEAKKQEALRLLTAFDEADQEIARLEALDRRTGTSSSQTQIDALKSQQELIKQKWASEFWIFNTWEKNWLDYQTSKLAGQGGFEVKEAEPGTSSARTNVSLDILEGRVREQGDDEEVVERLMENDFAPSDLLVAGRKQEQAIRIVLSGPEADKLLALVQSKPAEAAAQLRALRDKYEPTFKEIQSLSEDFNEFDPAQAPKQVGEVLKKAITIATENPVAATLGLVASVMAAYYAWNASGEGGMFRKAVKWGAGLTFGAVGLNYVPMFFGNGKTGYERLREWAYGPEEISFNGITNQLKSEVLSLTQNDDLAFNALMYLKDAKASTFLDAFESTLGTDPGQRKIDPKVFFAQGSIDSSVERRINERGLYEGVEALMIMRAKKSGLTGDRDVLAREGARIWREKYSSNGKDWSFKAICADLLGIEAPARTNLDGSSAEGRVDGSGIENPDSMALEHLFNDVLSQDVDVRYLSSGTFTINAFPLKVTKTEMPGKTLYKIVDPNNTAGLDLEILQDGNGGSQNFPEAEKIVKYVNDSVEAKFNEKYAESSTYKTVYNKEKNRWDVVALDAATAFKTPDPAAIEDITQKDLNPTFYVVMSEAGYLQLKVERKVNDEIFLEGGAFASVEKAMERAMSLEIHRAIKQDMQFVLGGLDFEIRDVASLTPNASGQTEISIYYHGREGKLVYDNGDVVSYKLDECPELREQWEILGKEAAYAFLNDKDVIDAFEQLRAAYEGQQHAAGLTSVDGWKAYWDQFAERISGKGAWYRSQEAQWFESVALQGLELESGIKHEFVELYRTNPLQAAYLDNKNSASPNASIYKDAKEKVSKLRAKANEIARRPSPDAGNVDDHRQREMKNLKETNINNQRYKDLVAFVDRTLAGKGWDAIGDEDLERARRIKNHIHITIFDLGYPIPLETAPSALQVQWMDTLEAQFENIMAVAQLSPVGNGLFGLDRRYNEASFDEALRNAGITSYESYAKAHGATTLSTGVGGGVSIAPTVGAPRTIEQSEVTKWIKDANEEILEAYGPSADISPEMEILMGLRTSQIIGTMTTNVNGLGTTTTQAQVEAAIKTQVDIAKREGLSYLGLAKDPERAMDILVEARLEGAYKADWKKAAIRAVRILSVLSSRNDRVKLASIYFDHIENGNTLAPSTSPQSPDDYTKFFLYRVYAQTGGIPTNLTWEQLTGNFTTTNEVNVAAVAGVDSYNVWKLGGASAEAIPEFDTNHKAKELTEAKILKFQKQKTKAKGNFMGKFDDGSSWFKIDGAWPTQYRAHVEERLDMITSEATNETELHDKIYRFAEFAAVEKAFYTLLIDTDVKSEDLELIFNVINPKFDQSWRNNDNAFTYGRSLWGAFEANYNAMSRPLPFSLEDFTAKIDILSATWKGLTGSDGELWEGWLPFVD